MNDIERTLKGPPASSACLAADGSGGSGAPREDDPPRSGIDLGDMLEMGLESLLMHFRKPGQTVRTGSTGPNDRPGAEDSDPPARSTPSD